MKKIDKIDEEEREEDNETTISPFKLAKEVIKRNYSPKIITEETHKKDLEIQMNFLKDSNKNIISLIKGKTELSSNPFFQYRLENNGINLYLINIYKSIKMNDIISLSNNLKTNKENVQNLIEKVKKKVGTLEHEINFITQEKIGAIMEKERLSDANETLNASILETMNQSNFQNERINPFNMSMTLTKNNLINDGGLFHINTMNNINNINNNNTNNTKKINDLKDKYIKLSKKLDKAKRNFPDMKKKVKNMKENNNFVTQQIKQKKMIYDQLNEELESLKEEMKKKGNHIVKKNSLNSQSSGTSSGSKKSKVGKFFKGLFG